MSQKAEIQVLSRILNLINRHHYQDEDGFAVSLSREFINEKNKSIFLRTASKIKTSFFRKNRVSKKTFLLSLFGELSVLKIETENAGFPKQVTIDDIDFLSKSRRISSSATYVDMLEKDVKKGFISIIGEPHQTKDWGGEYSDVFTTRVTLKGKRIATAFAFNGRGKIKNKPKGLTSAECGTNGDQIQRLFDEPAKLFILQSVSRIHRSVYVDMNTNAFKKSNGGKDEVYYCLIDGNDTDRIMKVLKGDKNG